jgi:hypothetical protein
MKAIPCLARTTRLKTMAGHLRTVRAALLLALLLLLTLPAAVRADDYTYTTNNNTITITGYTGPGGAVTIPDMISGLPVTCIGVSAFQYNFEKVSVNDNVIYSVVAGRTQAGGTEPGGRGRAGAPSDLGFPSLGVAQSNRL